MRFVALAAIAVVVAIGPSTAALSADSIIVKDAVRHAGEFVVPINKSQLLKVGEEFEEISVGNPEIADVVPLTKSSIYILGKSKGATSLTIQGAGGSIIAVADVVVTHDIEGLKSKLYELMPKERVEIRPAGEAIVISGQVSSAEALRKTLEVANRYAPGAVSNLLSIGGTQQVLLKVRFAEVERNTLKDIGVNTQVLGFSGNDTFSFGSGEGPNLAAMATSAASVIGGSYFLDVVIDALEEKGLVRTLAEPNIIALSGDTANFLAGGEFPIPVAQDTDEGGTTITVEFKQFGVGLSFTPTVIGEETINLELSTEVSAIDPTVSVQNNQIVIPGLKVRRANTTVELNDGHSFAIAGLIQDEFQDTVRQVPGLGNLPILGPLMRSTDYQRKQTELVVFITAHLVKPTTQAALATPNDIVLPPTHFELFLLGEIEAQSMLKQAAGIDGSYGYILP
jgi:pilus assembly protein CpaC